MRILVPTKGCGIFFCFFFPTGFHLADGWKAVIELRLGCWREDAVYFPLGWVRVHQEPGPLEGLRKKERERERIERGNERKALKTNQREKER